MAFSVIRKYTIRSMLSVNREEARTKKIYRKIAYTDRRRTQLRIEKRIILPFMVLFRDDLCSVDPGF